MERTGYLTETELESVMDSIGDKTFRDDIEVDAIIGQTDHAPASVSISVPDEKVEALHMELDWFLDGALPNTDVCTLIIPGENCKHENIEHHESPDVGHMLHCEDCDTWI